MKKILLNQPYLEGNERIYLNEVIDSGWLARGEYVKRFEKEFCKNISHTEYGVAVTSGTVAVHMALRGAGIHGDSGKRPLVAIPAYTCMSVAAAVKHANCDLVFLDIEPETYGIDFESFEKMFVMLEGKIDALILVHNYGFIARDTVKLVEFCDEQNIVLIEDASEAHGAELNGKRAGEFGDVSAFSCRSEKMIGVGEGGIVVTNDKEVADHTYYWVNDARPSEKLRYYVTDIGWNFHMPNAIGAIGLAQCEQFDEIRSRKIQVGEWYKKYMAEFVNGGYFKPMKSIANSQSVYWLNVFLLEDKLIMSRDDLMTVLEERGVETRPAFYPLNTLPPYVDELQDNCPVAKMVWERGIALPSNAYMTEEDVKYVVEAIYDSCRISK